MRYEVTALALGSGRTRLTLEAGSPDQACEIAEGRGLTVLDIRAKRLAWPRRRFPLVMFSHELLALLQAGLPLTEALQTLIEKDPAGESRRTIEQVLARLYQGESFSSALARFPEIFPPLFVATVRASERTSDLPESLRRFTAYQEQIDEVKRKLISASIYPVLLIAAGLLVSLFLLGYVVPRFSAVYEGNLANLPLASRWLMEWGASARHHGPMWLAGLFLLVALSGYTLSRSEMRNWLMRQFWRIPAVGGRLRTFRLSRFYRTVGMLLAGGIPAVQSLEMASGLLSGELREHLLAAAKGIREGASISSALESNDLTTPVAARMLRVGEKSGRMGEIMESIATFHDKETARWIDTFTRAFEPLLMAFIGIGIGAIVLLLYLPIFELAGSIE